jgi:hypothetical protein
LSLLAGNSPILFSNNSVERMRITPTGTVGVGTTTVAGGQVQINGQVSNTDGTGLDQGQLLLTDSDNNTSSGLMIGYRFQSGVAEYGRIQARNSVGATNLVLQGGGGNVGIGTAGPTTALQVNGTVTATAFAGAGTGLTGTASGLTVGTATNATNAVNATTATTATTANALNTGNSYTAVGYVSTATAGTALQVGDNSGIRNFGNGSTIYIDVAGGSASAGSLVLRNTNSFTAMATFSGSGTQLTSLGVGTAPSGTAGEIRATNNVTAYFSSDARLKENVQPIAGALGIVSAVGGKTFDWTDAYLADHGGEDGYFVRKSDFGVIAQDVEAVFPLAVRTREDGTKAVDYEKLVAVAFAAIAELRAEVDELRQQAVKVIK